MRRAQVYAERTCGEAMPPQVRFFCAVTGWKSLVVRRKGGWETAFGRIYKEGLKHM
ncbi:MAG: hypothetical protein IAC51_04690 [bacterium]|uniref:Uncharacterized protein n=1 Tax=Candidatus Aphodosoma intestinipullorum TaxID=2840674 RepID=A0A940DJR7_9BACT|nr:hypothetical protein [Candidatus Aphodosoma intestinipullorum]